MTFYEAALRVLEGTGRPLHVHEITELSIAQNLLSHVGKTPDQTMLSRLAAMARRTRDRRVIVTAKDTFALVEWAVPEDLEALGQTDLSMPHPEDGLPPLRTTERHPESRTDNVRAGGRGVDRKRRRDEDDELSRLRRRRFPPLSEVAFELLSEAAQPMPIEAIVQQVHQKQLCAADVGSENLLNALLEDNQRRIDAGRRPQFLLSREGQLTLDSAAQPGGVSPAEIQMVFADRLGMPFEGGRPNPDAALQAAARVAAKDARQATARALRKRLSELDAGTLERSLIRVLKGLSFHELRVVKRSRDGVLLTARRRDGATELRYTVRLSKGPGLDRRMVQDLRRDGNRYSAQLALLASPADLRGDARSEAQNSAGPAVILWCGDALAEKFIDAKTAVSVSYLEVFSIDEQFFARAKEEAEAGRQRREERMKDRQPPLRDSPDQEERVSLAAPESSTEPVPASAPEGETVALEEVPNPDPELDPDDFEEGGEGDDDHESAAESAGTNVPEGGASGAPTNPAAGRKRRRRRRGRRGRPRTSAPAASTPAGQPTEGSEAAVAVSPAANVEAGSREK